MPDYDNYTYSELEEALLYLDRDKWPERYEAIQQRLNDPAHREKVLNSQIEANKNQQQEEATEKARQKIIAKDMLRVSLFGTPGSIMLGLGLFGFFTEKPENLFYLLGEEYFVYGLLIVGGIIELWQMIEILRIKRKHKKNTTAVSKETKNHSSVIRR